MSGAAAVRSLRPLRAVVVPGWLAEVVRPRQAPVPWPEMARAALAICVPLSAAFAAGRGSLGVLPATGGLLGTLADAGGPYLNRVKRVCSAAVFGGAAGLAIGAVTHGHGALRPVWHTAAGFLLGVVWALILILPGWLHPPYGREQRDVAAVYDALAGLLRSVGGDESIHRPAAGAVLLALVHGTWLLIPFGLLAALLPFGRSRNYGLLATFPTPLVVVLIDLLSPGGWRLAEDRLIDTLIGCAIVLLIGFVPWPMSWYSHLPRQYARAALDVCRYLEEALGAGALGAGAGALRGAGLRGAGPPARSRMRRSTYRALADLRAEFQRTMSEPPSISRRATAWWPAVVALEQVMDAGTAIALAVSRGAQVPSSGVRQLSDALLAVSEAAAAGSALAEAPELPDDETLKPVTDAVRALLGVLGTGERLTVLGRAGVVGLAGFEPATSATQTRRASQAALQPVPG